MKVINITDAQRQITELDWLKAAELVHRQLRPNLPADYVARMKEVFASGGEMLVVTDGEDVLGVCMFRMTEKTHYGRELYCDDLITNEKKRSSGVGKLMLDTLNEFAQARGCDYLGLDSGTQRQKAHRFYFREGLTITAFHFVKPLK
ncbi:MAG: GNAT family N-acetyltransferase [Aeromicrobium sp.]|nr:GNAT family N-acetyltransferase [Burkholderiales bacterium]